MKSFKKKKRKEEKKGVLGGKIFTLKSYSSTVTFVALCTHSDTNDWIT